MRFLIPLLWCRALSTVATDFDRFNALLDEVDAQFTELGKKRVGAVFDAEITDPKKLRTINSPLRFLIDAFHETMSWDDAISMFESDTSSSPVSSDGTKLIEYDSYIISSQQPKTTIRAILLEEMIRDSIRVPSEQVFTRVSLEMAEIAIPITEIESMRRSILLLMMHPVWFHETLVQAHRENWRMSARGMIARIEKLPFPVAAHYFDQGFLNLAMHIWIRFCVSPLIANRPRPTCTSKTVHSVTGGRIIQGWALTKEMQRAVLVAELDRERAANTQHS